ncbi:MAG: IS110 family transposase [Bacteroidetes bacterium]|nr:IS110 family transposase [Bacteroidota bacterium]
MADNCKGAEVDLIDTIPGIASYSAAAIMIEIESIHRFATPSHLASYFGLHPVMKESGDKQFAYRMSKKGRSGMRALLYMCAQTSVLHDEHLKNIYHRHRSKGKNHKQAIGVIMHKMLRMIWGVLTQYTALQCNNR